MPSVFVTVDDKELQAIAVTQLTEFSATVFVTAGDGYCQASV